MAIQRRTQLLFNTRVALWLAWDRRCFYTREPLRLVDLEIDHLIPKHLAADPDELSAVTKRLGLPADFDLDSLANLVPTHLATNRTKGAIKMRDEALVLLLEKARARVDQVHSELRKLGRMAAVDRVLVDLTRLVHLGAVTVQQVVDFVAVNSERTASAQDLLVVSVGVGAEVFDGAVFYAPTCDALEDALMAHLRECVPGLVIQTEASDRSGESLTVRIGIWHFSLEVLMRSLPAPWELLEVARFSELYDNSGLEAFLQEAREE